MTFGNEGDIYFNFCQVGFYANEFGKLWYKTANFLAFLNNCIFTIIIITHFL